MNNQIRLLIPYFNKSFPALSTENKLIKREVISDLLYGKDEYIEEFTEATKESYGEFIEKYRKHVINQNMSELRNAGHKIKPVSQMLNLSMIIDEYEHAKELLEKPDVTERELEQSVERMKDHVDQIIDELDNIS